MAIGQKSEALECILADRASGCEADKPMAISERRAVTVLLTEEHLRKMIEDHFLKENEIGDRIKVARIVHKLLETRRESN